MCKETLFKSSPKVFSLDDVSNKETRIKYYKVIIKNANCNHIEDEFIDYMEYMHPESRLNYLNKLLLKDSKLNKEHLLDTFDTKFDIVGMIDEHLS